MVSSFIVYVQYVNIKYNQILFLILRFQNFFMVSNIFYIPIHKLCFLLFFK